MPGPGLLMRGWFERDQSDDDCCCTARHDDATLVVDANDCPGAGRLDTTGACRATVVDALGDRDASAVVVRRAGREHVYLDDDAALLCAAGRFVERVRVHDERLADVALTDPVAAAHEATGRAGPVATIAAETGLSLSARRLGSVESLSAHVGPTIAHTRAAPAPTSDCRLRDTRQLSTGGTVRRYDRDNELPLYHLEPPSSAFDDDAMATLRDASELVADGTVTGERAPWRAVRAVTDDDNRPVERLGRVLDRHTAGYGHLADLFDDPRVTDVFASAPVPDTPLRVRVDGELATTNLRVRRRGVDALASKLRRESGRAFSRASPTLDAAIEIGDRQVRVAGTMDPVSDGAAFALRAHDDTIWTLPQLVEDGTLPVEAAALLSFAVDRAAATLVAGSRGAGKTTLLGALLWEIDRGVRTLVIEDTPELPVEQLQATGREVQSLRTERGDGPGLPADETLRTALRLGESALVVGEVRGEEAQVLYEAMRVGAGGSAVLGTIHGGGGQAVRERVVSDLGVPASSFATTDLVVTTESFDDDGQRSRRVVSIEEVVGDSEEPTFEALYHLVDGQLRSTDRLERGNSELLVSLTDSNESYAEAREQLDARVTALRQRDREPLRTVGDA